MKLSNLALLLAVTFQACAGRPGSASDVPKPAIEKAADTKIPDAGPGDSDAGPATSH